MSKWVLIADAARGRLFRLDRANKRLVEINYFVNPEARLLEHSLSSDAPGRSYDSKGRGRHAIENNTSKKEQVKSIFAKRIAEHIKNEYKSKKFNKIIVAAPPKMLGYIEGQLLQLKAMDSNVFLAKDLSRFASCEIYKNLDKSIHNL